MKLLEFRHGNAPIDNPREFYAKTVYEIPTPKFNFNVARFGNPVNTPSEVNARTLANGMTIMTMKADIAQAVDILKQNFASVTFGFHCETHSHNDTVAYHHFTGTNKHGVSCYSMIEIFINGKFDTVRFINTYRGQITDIKIGNANYMLDNKGNLVLMQPDNPADEEDKVTEFRRELAAVYTDRRERLKILDELIHTLRRKKNLRIIEENPPF